MYLSQTRTWNSVICHAFLYSMSEGDRWSLFCWYWWNWWPSLFKLSFHKCTGMHSFCWYWWNCWPSLLILSYHNLIVNIFTNLIICLPVSKRKFFICGYSSLQKMPNVLLTCGKHLHDCIISTSREVWAKKTSLTLPLFIEVPVPRQENEWSCICVLGVLILPLSTILIFDFGIVTMVWYIINILFINVIYNMISQYLSS